MGFVHGVVVFMISKEGVIANECAFYHVIGKKDSFVFQLSVCSNFRKFESYILCVNELDVGLICLS